MFDFLQQAVNFYDTLLFFRSWPKEDVKLASGGVTGALFGAFGLTGGNSVTLDRDGFPDTVTKGFTVQSIKGERKLRITWEAINKKIIIEIID